MPSGNPAHMWINPNFTIRKHFLRLLLHTQTCICVAVTERVYSFLCAVKMHHFPSFFTPKLEKDEKPVSDKKILKMSSKTICQYDETLRKNRTKLYLNNE
jgi:hypothetical protein